MTALDPEQAFLTVNAFLRALWERTRQPGDLGLLLSMISYEPGDGSLDPAMWFDWLASVKKVQTGVVLPDRERRSLTPDSVKPLDPGQAYLAMMAFIEEYWLRVSRPAEISDLLGELRYTPSGGTTDPEMWRRWLVAIEKVQGEA